MKNEKIGYKPDNTVCTTGKEELSEEDQEEIKAELIKEWGGNA